MLNITLFRISLIFRSTHCYYRSIQKVIILRKRKARGDELNTEINYSTLMCNDKHLIKNNNILDDTQFLISEQISPHLQLNINLIRLSLCQNLTEISLNQSY